MSNETSAASAAHVGLPAGLSRTETYVVQREDTIAHRVDPRLPEVLATYAVVEWMELQAGLALLPHLPAGRITVGVQLSMQHLAPAPVGSEITVTATVTAVTKMLVTFDITATDCDGLISSATHTRAIVDAHWFEHLVDNKRDRLQGAVALITAENQAG